MWVLKSQHRWHSLAFWSTGQGLWAWVGWRYTFINSFVTGAVLEEEQEAEGDGSSVVWPSRRCNGLGGRPRWSVAHHTSHAALRGLICFNFLINRMEVRIPVPGVNILLFISNLMNKEKIFKATSKSKIWWRECFREMNLSEGSELEWDKRKFRRMNEGMEDFHNTLCFPSLQLHYSAFCHYMEIPKRSSLQKG